MIKELTNTNFESEIASDNKTLVDFWAPWCGPCRMLSPLVDALEDKNTSLNICKVNVDEQPNIAKKYSIAAIPTLLLFQKGEVIKKSVGLLSEEELDEFVK